MQIFKFSEVTFADLKRLVVLEEQSESSYRWDTTDSLHLTEQETWLIETIVGYIRDLPVHLLNEATVWARAVYPLLLLAETKEIRAWSELPLACQYPQFALEGVVDGVLGKSYAGRMDAPYLVVIEAKRGVEAQSPVAQSYAQMLAAAHLNWEHDQQQPQEIFGCYTIADTWTFMHAEVSDIETDKPFMRLETSREYVQKLEAETIARILKQIVASRQKA